MATVVVELHLDWINESDGQIDEIIKDEIISGVVARISSKVIDEIEKEARNKIGGQIAESLDNQVNKIMEELLNRRFDLTDKYGDVISENTSVLDEIKKRLDNFLEEKVDSNGNRVRGLYGDYQSRLDYIISKNIDYQLKRAIDNAVDTVKKRLENYVKTELQKKIGENIAKAIGLEQLVKLEK